MTLGAAALALLALMPSTASAQSIGACISLRGSTVCPAFGSASVSTNSGMTQIYPFLQFVSDTRSFDHQLSTYVKTSYVKD
ncbi:hypothetical protein ED733_007172, partial [Metarhizium rileyi]